MIFLSRNHFAHRQTDDWYQQHLQYIYLIYLKIAYKLLTIGKYPYIEVDLFDQGEKNLGYTGSKNI